MGVNGTNPFLIYLDNGRWEPRSYLTEQATWSGEEAKAKVFNKTREAYNFLNASGADVKTKSCYSRCHVIRISDHANWLRQRLAQR